MCVTLIPLRLKTAKMILFFTCLSKLVTTTVYTAYILVIFVKEYNMNFRVGRKIIGQIRWHQNLYFLDFVRMEMWK